MTTIDHRFKPGDRVVVDWCDIQTGTFVRYRTAEEMADWRPDEDCFVNIDRDWSPGRVFNSSREVIPIGEVVRG